jgi:hypothetical protein
VRPSEQEEHAVPSRRRITSHGLVALVLAVVFAGCGTTLDPSPAVSASSSPPASDGAAATDLSVIGCAGDDPAGKGELSGAWAGNDSGVYYIRQVGDCVWWFGTEVKEIERGVTDQLGFANVASGRIRGTRIDLEWADGPLGNTTNGGGLTFFYDQARGELTLVEQRGGGQAFGGSVLTRIEPHASPVASSSPSTSP